MPASGETAAHRELKRLAVAWARTHGWLMAAPEVRVPKSNYRADVAACAPSQHSRWTELDPGAEGRAPAGSTVVFECKQARADFLKDAHDDAATKATLAKLLRRRKRLEALLGEHRPDLRRGESLFPEFDAWDFSGLEHKGYHALLAEIATAQGRVLQGTKFSKMLHYRSADFLYLVVEDDIYAEAEIPAGWGLLVRKGETLEQRRKPAVLDAGDAQRRALLESIALKATRPKQ
jgi:hypothetical protein